MSAYHGDDMEGPSARRLMGDGEKEKKVCQRSQGALWVLAAVPVVLERYASVLKNSTADRKAVKVLLNNKIASARIDANVRSFVSTVAHPRQPNKGERERGVDKAYPVTDRIPFKKAKAIHMVHIIGELQARPTIIFSLYINHKNAITKLKEFEGS
jgi:hypothetical protein